MSTKLTTNKKSVARSSHTPEKQILFFDFTLALTTEPVVLRTTGLEFGFFLTTKMLRDGFLWHPIANHAGGCHYGKNTRS
jgi:hypothetical protein